MRMILETAAARLAAEHAGAGDLEHLELILEQMLDTSLPLERRIALDADFHVSIARSGGNELVGMFVEVMTILLREYMLKGISGPAGMKKTSAQHRNVLDAIKSRDPEAAEAGMRKHLTAARKNVWAEFP